MAIDDAVLKDVETRLKKILMDGFYSHTISDDEAEYDEVIEVDFTVSGVRSEEEIIVFDCSASVRCPPFAQETAVGLIEEEWVPDAISKVREAAGDYEIMATECEIDWEEDE